MIAPVRFSGLTRLLTRRPPTPAALSLQRLDGEGMSSASSGRMLGTLPPTLQRLAWESGSSPQDMLGTFQDLVRILQERKSYAAVYVGSHAMSAKLERSSRFSTVYRVAINDIPYYALKFYTHLEGPHGVEQEAAAGLHYTAQKRPQDRVADVVDFHMAQIYPEGSSGSFAGWALFSWVQPDGQQAEPPRSRSAKSPFLEKALYQAGLVHTDAEKPGNRQGWRVVDLGGIMSLERFSNWLRNLRKSGHPDEAVLLKHRAAGFHPPSEKPEIRIFRPTQPNPFEASAINAQPTRCESDAA